MKDLALCFLGGNQTIGDIQGVVTIEHCNFIFGHSYRHAFNHHFFRAHVSLQLKTLIPSNVVNHIWISL